MPPERLQVVEGVDVVEGVAVEGLGHARRGGGGARVEDGGEDPHHGKLAGLGRHLGLELQTKVHEDFTITEKAG